MRTITPSSHIGILAAQRPKAFDGDTSPAKLGKNLSQE
jgi:hypothetical protein